jgi:hypothetical protein
MAAYARVKTDLHFISTNFRLKKGEIVEAVRATNIPGKGYYVDPVDDRGAGAKMLVQASDIKLF